MPALTLQVHPKGLHPIQAALAFVKHSEQGMSLVNIIEEGEIHNMSGDIVGKRALWAGIKRVAETGEKDYAPQSGYSNCGRNKALSEAEIGKVIGFVKQWRAKRFCTCRYIKHELKLKAAPRTTNRVLNEKGYYWRTVPRRQGFTKEQLEKRKVFIEQHLGKSPSWWEEHMNIVLDGVTLTMPPKPLSARQKHAAQRITAMWLCPGESFDNDVLTFNRYGVQLGVKVPLWGGFTGNGRFTLRMWTPKPKMTMDDWKALVPTVREAVDEAYGDDVPLRPRVWHDNERFLLCPEVYEEHGLTLVRFPPNSGDLNPIETVWAWLRRDLAKREIADIEAKRYLTEHAFRQRCSQILSTYAVPRPGEEFSRLQKLLRGMPRRLRKAKANRYGRCGK